MQIPFLENLATRSKNIMAVLVLIVFIAPAVWWLVGDNIKTVARNLVNEDAALRCVIIPPNGHVIESARAGEWATVTWHDIERFDDCGRPEVSGVLANGDGIYHDVEMSISGVNLDLGINPELRYQFKIPESSHAGRAWFRVTLDYPSEGRSINSPRIYFTILDAEA